MAARLKRLFTKSGLTQVWQSNMESESSLGRGSSITRTCSDSARSSAENSHFGGLYGISL